MSADEDRADDGTSDDAEGAPAAPRTIWIDPKPKGNTPIFLFFDGAYDPASKRMGVACILRHGFAEKVVVQPLGDGTLNLAELKALEVALATMRQHDNPLLLVTDCQYLVKVLSGQVRAHTNIDTIKAVAERLATFPNVRFRKIPHRGPGNPENDEVSRLANLAAKKGYEFEQLRQKGFGED